MTGQEGAAILAQVTDRAAAGEPLDAILVALRRRGLARERAAAVVSATIARLHARSLLPDADRLVFTRGAFEQASHPSVSEWRAHRFAGVPVVADLCAGAGGDTLALGAVAARVVAVDLDAGRLVLNTHNAASRGVAADPVAADALRPPVGRVPVHADPGRREGERRSRCLADTFPPVPALLTATARAPGGALTLSPAFDLADPDLPADAEVEFVQFEDRLVEATLWTGGLRVPGRRATATLLPGGETLARDEVVPRLPVGTLGGWLVEVVPAAVRARLHDRLGAGIGARRLARRRALLTTDDPPPASPWWRAWRVEAQLPPRARAVRAWLRGADPLPLEISVRGLDLDPGRVWVELGRPPRGPQGRRLILVRLDGGGTAIVCRQVSDLRTSRAVRADRSDPLR